MDIRNAALAFSLGVVGAHGLLTAQPLWACWLAAGAAMMLTRRARTLGAALVGIGFGCLHAADAVEPRVEPACAAATLIGRITDIPTRTETPGSPSSHRFVVLPESASCELRGAVRLTWLDGPVLRAGERWRLQVRLKRPRGTANAHGFDAERWFVRTRLSATGYVVSGTRMPVRETRAESGDGTGVASLRGDLRGRLEPLPLVNEGVIAALTLGDKGGIPASDIDLYRRTGTMHLLVISGLHIGIVTAAGFLVGRGMGILFGIPPRHVGVATALLLAGAYTLLAGAGMSLVRAFVMSVAGMLALLGGRTRSPSAVFAYALAVVLALDPLAPLGTGFWLSFGAVAVLLAYFGPRRRPRGWVASAVRAQLAIAFVFVPSTTAITGLIHPLGIVANLVAVPAVTLLVVPLALAGVAMVATPVGPWLLTGADFCVSLVGQVLSAVDQVEPIYVQHPGVWLGWLAALSASCLLPLGRVAGIALISALAALLFIPAPSVAPGQVDVTVLDVGQGTAVLVTTANHSLVYDTGPSFPSGGDTGSSVVLPVLRGRGVSSVDRLILSHADLDHTGGAVSVLAGVLVGETLAGEPVEGVATRPCIAGMGWRWDGVDFSILSPRQDHRWSGNNASCVLSIETAATRVLLAGDIESVVEQGLVPGRVDVLLVPHHGSATSSTPGFVAGTRPVFAIAGTGFDNRFGHPHPAVVERYRRVGSHFVSTAMTGAVRWRSGQPETISVQRCRDSRYWRSGSMDDRLRAATEMPLVCG